MLTESQASVLRILRAYTRDHGIAPTLNELCELTRTKSPGSMSKHLNALVEKGFIERSEGGWRQIQIKNICPCCGRKMRKQ